MNEMERLERIRRWLRYHSDYHLTIEPWGLYGLWSVQLTLPGGGVRITRGESLEGRLAAVEEWIGEVTGRWCASCGKALLEDEGSLCEACLIQLEV